MKWACKLFAVALAAVFSLNLSAQSTADAELSLGVAAYKQARFAEAVQHLERAISIDPDNQDARLYLATAYAEQYIPGVGVEDNDRIARRAVEQYKAVLELDPNNINAAKGLASLYSQMKKIEEAKIYWRKTVEIDPNDAEPYFSIGVIDWTVCYQLRMEKRAKLALKPDDRLNSNIPRQQKVCDDLKAKNTSSIEEGIESLNKAIELRPDYDDAMAYLNLMYREKADLECDDPAAQAADLKTADVWVDKTMAARKAKAEGSSKAAAPNPQ